VLNGPGLLLFDYAGNDKTRQVAGFIVFLENAGLFTD
jgi:hypothetical protein